MKTRCPVCQTVFRVTPEQLKARAGKVRCGECQAVFNALDNLIDAEATPHAGHAAAAFPSSGIPDADLFGTPRPEEFTLPEMDDARKEPVAADEEVLDEFTAHELGKATGLILPRETTEIPGYNKWAEGVMTEPFSMPVEKPSRGPFVFASLMLVLALAGQLVFHFRSELAVALPVLRPALDTFSKMLDSELPLPRHAELLSIETSDLQTDPSRGNLLVLNATLRNRAKYAQAYPSLELSLTDTQDAAIVRRVFVPEEYLPKKTPPGQPFAANSDLAVRLWLEVQDVGAAGYRLYVFYP